MSSFDFYGPHDTQLDAYPAGPPGAPAVWLHVRQGHDSANVLIPLDRVEEVVAGIRDMARQAGNEASPAADAYQCWRKETHEPHMWTLSPEDGGVDCLGVAATEGAGA